ncbi:MAG: lytic transglycosylase domain-containing protein [Pseudomonadales bacterium]|nr:lytic transglycosylase domain-containing protein [Pseudomonadales bacterium]
MKNNLYFVRQFCVFLLLFLSIIETAKCEENCWYSAAERYQVSPHLLYAIASKESSLNPNAIGYNRNGTHDIGLMQINSVWLAELRKYGITRKSLFDPCVNINVGAWVLAQSVQKLGYNWNAIGAYHTGLGKSKRREERRSNYSRDVYRRIMRMQRF